MAARGDVLTLRRPLGFLPNARLERFLVVQADAVTRALETVIVAPLDEALDMYSAMPGAVPLTAREAGSSRRHVALLTQLAALPRDRFEPVASGHLDAATRKRIDGVLRLVLDL